jgi:putative aldouronate transport system substrate-binding protein
MKRNIAKAAILGLTVFLVVFTLLSGCSKGDSPGAASPNAPSEANSAGKEKPSITVSMYDRGNIPQDVGTVDNNLWTKWVNENSGVNVKFIPVPRSDSVKKFNTLVAADQAPDLILEYDSNFRNQLYTQKQILPLDDLIEKYSTDYKQLLEQFPLLRKLGTKPDGKLYEFGRVLGYIPGTFLFIRQDWLDKLNLKVPETDEEAFEVMKAFATEDPDGNGKADTFGTNLSGAGGGWVDTMFQNVGWVVDGGKLVKDWDRVAAAVAYKKRLFEEGLVDKDYLTDNAGKKSEQDFLQGKIGIYGYMGNVVQVYNNYQTLKKNDPNAKLAVIALPRSQFGQFSPEFNPPIQMTGVINAKAASPEGVMKFVDFMSSASTVHTMKYGLEGVHYKMENGKEVTLDKDKYDKEVSWLGDFRMLGAQYLINEFDKYLEDLDLSNPFDKDVHDMMVKANELYISKDRPIANFTLGQYMPGLPNDMQFIADNVNQPVNDIWNKAIVGGSGYTVEQAAADAKSTWKKSDGEKLEKWYADWYAANKDTWVFTKDLYDMQF